MISDKQLQANKRNAQKSTGPKTAEGKMISSKNATTHGLLSNHVVIKDEKACEFQEFCNLMTDYFKPVGILEQLLVNRISASFWRLNRAGRIEVEMLNSMFTPKKVAADKKSLPFIFNITKTYAGLPEKTEYPIDDKPVKTEGNDSQDDSPKPADLKLGQAVVEDFTSDNLLDKFHRYKSHIDKTLYKAIHELQRLQSTRRGQNVPPPQTMDVDINTRKGDLF